jgi:hypothetical protein
LVVPLASLPPPQGWTSQGKDERRYALQAVEPAIRTLGTEGMHEICALKEDSISQEKAKENLGELAVILLKTLEIETRWYYRLVGTLRRSERSSVWPTLVPATSHPAARFHSLVKSARRATGRHDDLKKLARKANKHDTWWQVSYNAACGYATYAETLPCPSPTQRPGGAGRQRSEALTDKQDAAMRAMEFFEQTLVRPGVEQLSADWARRDPDLAVLAAEPRFQRFITQLRSGT